MIDFPKDFFALNRQRLRESFAGDALMIFSANALLQKKGDTTFPFKQDANFWYLTGLLHPELLLVMDSDREYIVLPHRSETSILFGGAIDIDTIKKASGIKHAYSHEKGWARLSRRIKKAKFIATISQKSLYDKDHDMFINPAGRQLVMDIAAINSTVQLIDLTSHITKLRMVKQPLEIKAISEACQVSSKLFASIAKNYKKFKSERDMQIHVAIDKAKNQLDFAYEPIIANHANANTLHYTQVSDDTLHGATLFDIGYEYNQYASDISRTYALNNSRYSQVYDAVIDVYNFAFNILKPGLTRRDLELKTRAYMGEKLRELGLIDVITQESISQYFPHALGHHVGLEVHDVQSIDVPFAENMVVTIEPGIYIKEEGLGVRFENTVLVTSDGCKNLCEKAPVRV